jgi:TonB-linked SusC/RagA family outer membrane protein
MFKIRASYGLVGNDKLLSDANARFSYMETVLTGEGGYAFGENTNATGDGRRLGRYAKPDISWETSRKFDLGVELSFLGKGRLMLDYFADRRGGIFLERKSIPGIAGFTAMPLSNVGRAANRGFEAEMEWNQKIGGDWSINARGTFTYNRSEILNDDQPTWHYPYQTRIGKPIDPQWGLLAAGLFSSQDEIDGWARQTYGPVRVGDIKYVDVNSDGVIDTYDEVAIGRTPTPEIVYGFGASVRWRNLDVSFQFQGVGNTTFFMSGYSVRPFSSPNLMRSNMYEAVWLDRWSVDNPNPDAMFPRLSIGENPNNFRNSTFWQRDHSFLRLKNAEIGYTLPRKVTSKLRMDYVRVYVSGVNLVTFSPFKLWDPEMNNTEGRGYPPNRIINFGLTINI